MDFIDSIIAKYFEFIDMVTATGYFTTRNLCVAAAILLVLSLLAPFKWLRKFAAVILYLGGIWLSVHLLMLMAKLFA